MHESEMYKIIRNGLEKIGLKEYTPSCKKVRIYKTKKCAGQDFIELDVVAHKNSKVWIFECKKPCTVEQFSFALGQIIGYKTLLEKTNLLDQLKNKICIDKIDQINFSVVLLRTQRYPLGEQINIFRAIFKKVNFNIGFITIDEMNRKLEKMW